VFDKVIAGIDGTRASFEAGRQAGGLTDPGGALTLVAATDPMLTLLNRWGPHTLVEEGEIQELGGPSLAETRLAEFAEESLAAMRAQLDSPAIINQRVVDGTGRDALRQAAIADHAQLIALGDHGYRRMVGIARSSTVTELLHEAPCSVLIARHTFDPAGYPRNVVVGVDGSDGALAALEVAKSMVAASGGGATGSALVSGRDDSEFERIAQRAAPLAVTRTEIRATRALTKAAEAADLLIVGARGLSGAAALGSVSERVAHAAESSVLVVRTEA